MARSREHDGPLFHIAERDAVQRFRAAEADGYRAESLGPEGFIHCSTQTQLAATAHRYYGDRLEDDELALLTIDPARLRARLVFEDTTGRGEVFPHVYGPIDAEAIVAEEPLRAGLARLA